MIIMLMIKVEFRTLIAFLLLAQASLSLQFNFSAQLIPHPQKVSKGGEDAFHASQSLLVVSDGVGGWNKQGIDPSLYSRFLCSASEVYFNEEPYHYSLHPEQLIFKAQRNNRHPGSATMSVVTIEGNTIRSCHIGDCRLFVLRRFKEYRLIYETVDLMHKFNYPYQLAQDQYGGDDPRQAICSSLAVRPGDLLILASDGMVDNIFPYEVLNIAQKAYQSGRLDTLAKRLAKIAVERGKKKQGISPFGAKAKQWGINYVGGKIDDTTVVVAEVVSKIKNAQGKDL